MLLAAAGDSALAGLMAWHGSRMETYLDRAAEISCPLRFHFGAADPITPPNAIEKIRAAFSAHPDISIVVYPGLEHGFSHEGKSYDRAAAQASLEDTRALLALL